MLWMQVVKGIIEGCNQAGCALLGGETAEMPGFYKPGEYDLAGFAVGAVKQDRLIDGSKVQPGDLVLALRSSGVHSNGFSLVRKVLEVTGTKLTDPAPWEAGKRTVGEVRFLRVSCCSLSWHVCCPQCCITMRHELAAQALLEPTVIYTKKVVALHEKVGLKGVVHITGGGMTDNLPRVIPKGMGVDVQTSSYKVRLGTQLGHQPALCKSFQQLFL
jgi:phosphoribosylformylglycinamidine cyclo-ligase